MPGATTPSDASRLLGETYEAVTTLAAGLAPQDFRSATRAAGWTVQDLLFHLLLDAQRALVTLASPTDEAADVDAVSYWSASDPAQDDGGAAHARYVRLAASAYSTPDQLVGQWRETSRAAARAATECRHQRVRTQGHVLAVPDLVETLVVEATVHHLDLTMHLTGPPPPAAALRLVRRTLDGLLGAALPLAWDDRWYALVRSGRLPLGRDDREALGLLAERFPLLG